MNGESAQITAWVVVVATFFLICFDMWIGFRLGATATVSRQLGMIGQQYPILAFALGVVVGHTFWPLKL